MRKTYSNRTELKYFRRRLRNNSTSAEARLWEYLKNKKLVGRKFRRQHSLGNYIVDFFCPSEMLIIELDGDPHGDYYKIELDKKRDADLEGRGYRVLRFENRFVFQDPDHVKSQIINMFIHK
jgi:very-short-patch-repair endonuclease